MKIFVLCILIFLTSCRGPDGNLYPPCKGEIQGTQGQLEARLACDCINSNNLRRCSEGFECSSISVLRDEESQKWIAINTCERESPTPTITPTPVPSITPTPTPTPTPVLTPTPTPTPTVTPTPDNTADSPTGTCPCPNLHRWSVGCDLHPDGVIRCDSTPRFGAPAGPRAACNEDHHESCRCSPTTWTPCEDPRGPVWTYSGPGQGVVTGEWGYQFVVRNATRGVHSMTACPRSDLKDGLGRPVGTVGNACGVSRIDVP